MEPAHVTSPDGTQIAYWRTGTGKPLVLVHGTTADHTRFDPLRAHLEAHAELYIMDRRGRGKSGDNPSYDVAREFEDVAALVDHVAEETGSTVHLFGHSFGAFCALEAATRTRNLRGLILYEPLVFPAPHASGFSTQAEALIAEGRRDEVVELFFRVALEMPEGEIARLRAHPSWQVRVDAAHTLSREDHAEATYVFDAERFRSVDVRTLLLQGGRSASYFRESTDAIAHALPDVRIATMERQDHFAVVSAPETVAWLITLFLGDDEQT